MKKSLFLFGVLAACVAGGLIALRLDRMWTDRQAANQIGGSAPLISTALDAAQPVDFRPAVKRLLPSIVSIDRLQQVSRSFFSRDYEVAATATGSGVIVSPAGHVVTNHHVVKDAYSLVVRLGDGRSYDAKIVGSDPISDIAVLKIEAKGLVPAELGDNSRLEVGEWVIAMGNPLGFSNTVSVGIVSSLNRSLPSQNGSVLVEGIQTDAAINQGNSGGALANMAGQVVGINSTIASTNGGSVGLGFAIPINRVQRVVDDILKHGRARYGTPGIAIVERPGLLAREAIRASINETVGAMPPNKGVIVRAIMPEGPSDKAGIGELDVLLEIDGSPLVDPFDYTRALVDKRPGDKARVKFWSKGAVKTVEITLIDS